MLITGIGGGVALIVLQLCIAKGASVYVTSSNPEKIQKAIALGAKGGANYKDSKCRTDLYRTVSDRINLRLSKKKRTGLLKLGL